MKGIMFNLLEDFLTDRFGEEKYDEILTSCELHTKDPFIMVAPGTYSDADFGIIVATAAKMLKMKVPDLLRDMGRYALPKQAERYSNFFTSYEHPKEFLNTIAYIHQIEIKKLYKNAELPEFSIDKETPDQLILTYRSKRRLCHLAEGLIAGLGDYYGIPFTMKQIECVFTNGQQCTFELNFSDHLKVD